jgi:hypothetical protein
MPRTRTEVDQEADLLKKPVEAMQRAAQELAQKLRKDAVANNKAANSTAPLNQTAQQLERAAAALQDVAGQARVLTEQQNAEIENAVQSIATRDVEALQQSVVQMTRDLERLETERAGLTGATDRIANDWQTKTLDAARRAAELASEGLKATAGEPDVMAPDQELRKQADDLSGELREHVAAARRLYEEPEQAGAAEPSQQAAGALDAARELEQVAGRVDAARENLERAANVGEMTEQQQKLVAASVDALRERNSEELSKSTVALDQERARLEKTVDEGKQRLSPDATIAEAVEWKARQARVADDQRQLETVKAAQELARAASAALLDRGRLEEKMFGDALANDFAKTPALEAAWNDAKAGKEPNAEGFAASREAFWRSINARETPQADAVATMLDAAGYRLGEGAKAPTLKQSWSALTQEAVDRIAQRDPDVAQRLRASEDRVGDRFETLQAADRRLSIDHLDPQSKSKALTLES